MLSITAFYMWASIQGIFLSFNILQFRAYKANWYLIAFVLLTAINIFFQYILIFTDFKFRYPEYVFVSDALGLLYGPVLYLYCRKLIYNKLEKRSLLHFLPAVLFCIYFFLVEIYLGHPFEFHNYIGQPEHLLTLVLILISSVVYLGLCWSVIKRVKHSSEIVEFKFVFWLEALLIVLCLKTIFNVLSFGHQTFVHLGTTSLLVSVKNITFIASNVIVLVGLQLMISKYPFIINKDFSFGEDEGEGEREGEEEREEEGERKNQKTSGLSNSPDNPHPENKPKDDTGKNINSDEISERKEAYSVPAEDAEKYLLKLDSLMNSEKPYLDAGLTEKDVASHLDIQPYILSKLLNQHLGKRFNEYINEYRIENAKKMLTSGQDKNLTMFVISIESGFKSESAFYNNFKRFTGLTPKAYQQKVIQDEASSERLSVTG